MTDRHNAYDGTSFSQSGFLHFVFVNALDNMTLGVYTNYTNKEEYVASLWYDQLSYRFYAAATKTVQTCYGM